MWIASREKGLPPELLIDPRLWWLDIALGVGIAAALVGLWRLARRYLAAAEELEYRLADILRGIEGGEVLGLAVLSGFAEELFFRGAVQGSWGLVPATLLFALLHTGPDPSFRLWTLFAAIAGLALGGVTLWRGNLLAAILAHFLVNAVNLGHLARLPRREEGPPPGGREGDTAAGGAGGDEGSGDD